MTPAPWILPFDSPQAELATVGGKGRNLMLLAQAGFPVPPGFVITTSAYRDVIQANALHPFILATLESVSLDDPDTLETASAAIRERISQCRMPEALAQMIVAAYNEQGQPPVAARSSATAEDLPDLSFAGQQDTYLNIVGGEALLEAVVNCWSSLWTARAISYRARNQIPHDKVALAVVVQRLVESDVSGVLFTANPLSGKRTETVIDATWGLGEALVAGMVEPDHYVVDTKTGRILDKQLGRKALVIHPKAGGGTWTVTMSEEALHTMGGAQAQALNDAEIMELVGLGRRVAAAYDGAPQDIEWAWCEDEGFYLLQARPITNLYPLPPDMPPEPLQILFSFGAVQGMLDPITPLGRDILITILLEVGAVMGLHASLETQQVFLVAGERLYLNLTRLFNHKLGRKLLQDIASVIEPGAGAALATVLRDPELPPPSEKLPLRRLLKVAPIFAKVLRRFASSYLWPEANHWRVRTMIETAIADARVQVGQAPTLAVMLDWYEQILDNTPQQVFPELLPRLAAAMSSLNFLMRLARQTPEGEKLALEITRGLPNNVTTEMDLALWQTAQAIRKDPSSLAAFQTADSAELAQRYLANALPEPAQEALQQFLKRYGVRGLAEIDAGRPRWREEPAPLMQALQSYLRIEDDAQAPDVIFALGAAAAAKAAERLAAILRRQPKGRLKAKGARILTRRLRALAGLRETPKWFIINLLAIFREGVLAGAEQLVAENVVNRPDDVFFLRLAELRALAQGERQDWQELIAERRAVYEREKRRKRIPRLLLSDGRAFYEGLGASSAAEGVITGSPVSPGVAEGRVRVVFDPHQANLNPGDILVCPGTDPSWTPLFLAAGGLVMEVGGMMTHGSVVAREYGIPAVVGVHEATSLLHTGQRVLVNGSTGEIVILDDKEEDDASSSTLAPTQIQ